MNTAIPQLDESLRSEVWAHIMTQATLLQEEMRDVGYMSMTGGARLVDGTARTAGVIFVAQGGGRQAGEAMDFEGDVSLLTISPRGRSYEIQENAEDSPSFQTAADYLVGNIVTYMAAVTPDDAAFRDVTVALSATDGLTITCDGNRPWVLPGAVDTADTLRAFVEAEIDALSERIGVRYLAYAQRQLDSWHITWPEANFSLGLINGSTQLHADLPDGRRQLLNHWRDEEIDEVFPGLAAEFAALVQLEAAMESRVMPAINGTYLTPTVVLDEEEPSESPSP